MKRQGGFTLIELVVVIVILGILAVTAAPKFLNLQSDARASSLQGLKGAMAGASGIVYGKAAIEGKETKADTTLNDKTEIVYGYPKATSAGIVSVVIGLNEDWNVTISGSTLTAGFLDSQQTECVVTYSQSVSGAAPVITAATTAKC